MKEFLEGLNKLGFTQYEARLYFALVQKNPVTGYELGKLSGVPHSKVYENIKKLLKKGAVIELRTEPVKYAPLPPDELLSRYKNEFKNIFSILEKRLKGISKPPIHGYIWTIIGYNNILNKIIEIIKGAKNELYISAWPEEIRLVKDEIINANNRGVKIRSAIFGDDILGVGLRYPFGIFSKSSLGRLKKRLTAIIADNNELLVTLIDSIEESRAVWTTDETICLIAIEYIKHDIMTHILIDDMSWDKFEDMCKKDVFLKEIFSK